MSNTFIEDWKWGYLAGLIDGEGCICITTFNDLRLENGKAYRATLQIGMTDEKPVQWIAKTFGGKVYPVKPHKHCHKPSFQWTLRAAEAALLLTRILPYLQVKRKQAENLIKFNATMKGRGYFGRKGLTVKIQKQRQRLWQNNKKLNQKGVQ